MVHVVVTYKQLMFLNSNPVEALRPCRAMASFRGTRLLKDCPAGSLRAQEELKRPLLGILSPALQVC